MDFREAYNATDVGKIIGVSRPVVYELLNRQAHPIPSFRVGRRRIIPRQQLMDWMREEAEMEAEK